MSVYWKIQTQDIGSQTQSFKMKSNAIRLYKHACEMAINPIGVDTLERTNVQNHAIKSKAMWEDRFKTAKKYKVVVEKEDKDGNIVKEVIIDLPTLL